jgi:hypothetical protein
MASDLEAKLVAVKSEDKPMVMDVMRVVQALKCCGDYTINVAPKGYELLCWLRGEEEVELSMDEAGLLNDVNPTRIRLLGLRVLKGGKCCLRVRVISLSEPCMMSDTILLSVRKRARFWG